MKYSDDRLADYTDDSSIKRGSFDVPFLLITLLLLTIGIVMVLSASFARAYYDTSVTGGDAAYYFRRQIGFALLGVIVMLGASRLPINFFRRFSPMIFLFALVLLVLVLVGGVAANGSRRWFSFGNITFQPSEIAKIAVILFEADLICRFRGKMTTFKYGVLPFILIVAIVDILLILEPHLSASIIVFLLTVVMMYIGGTKLRWFLVFGGGASVLVAAYIAFVGYSNDRFSAWLNPFADSSDTGYQIIQSLYAIGSGGLTGLGLGQSRQKYLYLPEEHNDYIFSIICEELGFVGAMLILALFALLIIRGFWLAVHCRDRYSFLVCAGISSLLAIQVLLNVAVVTNTIPSTGISLPFFSYGGTALLIQLGEMGIILSISRDIPEKKRVKEKKQKKQKTKSEPLESSV